MAYWAYDQTGALGRVNPDPRLYSHDWLVFLGLLFITLTHGALALDLWSNGVAAAERLRCWFVPYLLGGILAAPGAFVIVARPLKSFGPAFAAFVAVMALPFYQRHLPGQIVGPEEVTLTSGLRWLREWLRKSKATGGPR